MVAHGKGESNDGAEQEDHDGADLEDLLGAQVVLHLPQRALDALTDEPTVILGHRFHFLPESVQAL